MKHYPEFPETSDQYIKDLAEECGVKNFKRAEHIRALACELSITFERQPEEIKLLKKFMRTYGQRISIKPLNLKKGKRG